MTDADMIEAMARAIGPSFIGNRMPDMSGDPLRKATPYERRRIDEAVTAALAVVQPELDRLRAENVELSHREKVRSEAINRALTCQRELAEEARSVADLANKLFDQREEYLSGLTARNAELSAENARLRSALEPFASRAGRYDPVDNDDGEPDWSTAAPSIRIGDLRRARSELESGHE